MTPNRQCRRSGSGNSTLSNTQATFSWTPTATGSHTLEATQEVVSNRTATVNVVDCTPSGGGSGWSASNPLTGLLGSLSAQ
ncbi:hypothetical protein [Nocardia sp. NPDC046763]|uniref:hypothetical protein n=1 Tax=Nocardia sp. NPDC046763 TaxID=3155256 RepID=UPI0033DF675C